MRASQASGTRKLTNLRKYVVAAVGLAALVFLALGASQGAEAYWSAQATVTSSAKVASLSDSCSNVTSVVNASFEQPAITQGYVWLPNGQVPGWSSTDPVGIEVWQSGFNGVAAPVGNQFVELNANTSGTLSQSIVSTSGQILQWSLLHRGRAGVDTMQLLIGSSASTLQPIRTISDGTAAWGRYSGAYVVPAGQTTTYLAFRAISTATGDLSVGNFMDDVSFGSGPCLTAASTVSNITNPGSSLYHPGDVVQYSTRVSNIGSALSYTSAVTAPLPSTMAFKPGSLKIDGTTETDAGGDDQAEYTAGSSGNGTVTARLGDAASASAGGTIAQGTGTTVSFQAVVTGAVGTVIHYLPNATYTNGLAPLWALSPAASADVPITLTAGVDVGLTAATPSPSTLTAGVTAPSTWSFATTNNSTAAANNVVVHLSAPAGYVSTTPPAITGGSACTTTSSTTADCTIGGLAAGATKTITLAGYAAGGTTPGSLAISATVTSTSGDPTPANNTATGTATVVADTTAPSTVTGVVASATTESQTTLTWAAATDNVGVTAYDIYRGSVFITTVTNATTFTNTLLNPSTAYVYTVKARDAAGNTSAAFSTPLAVTSSGTFTSGTYYRIASSGTTFCITTGATPPLAASTLILATCDATTPYQKWGFFTVLNKIFTTTPNYFIAPDVASSILSWDVTGTGKRAKADIATAVGMTQQWNPVAESGGTFHFINVATSTCLTLPGTAVANLQLEQTPCTTSPSPAQSFTLAGVTP